MMKDITSCTVFTTALCNLNCSYCYICKDKDGNLENIDKDLASDWESNAYIKQLLDLDENIKNQLTDIELWGGEPFLHMERFTDHFQEFVDTFPKFNTIRWSTNFTIPNQAKIIESLLDLIDRVSPQEEFFIDCQISIDGPKEMNDKCRGNGVTDKILENFKDLCYIKYNSKKIKFQAHTKPTLSKDSFEYFMTEDQTYEWFNFFDKNMCKVHSLSNAPWTFNISLFNNAMPSDWTPEDGLVYAKILQNIENVEQRVKDTCPGFRGFISLIPNVCDGLRRLDCTNDKLGFKNYISYCPCPCANGTCGAMHYSITLIPNNKFAVCHRGIFDSYIDYCENFHSQEDFHNLSKGFYTAKNTEDWIFDKEQIKTMYNMTGQVCKNKHSIWYTDLLLIIREYAYSGIIDSKYQNVDNVVETLCCLLNNATCIQDNYIANGSWTTPHFLEVPLLYNGAMDIIMRNIKRIFDENKEGGRIFND